jgi:hypothetical protein
MINLFVAALWHFLGDGWARWVVCTAILALIYVFMATVGMKRKNFGARSYRYAE